MGSLALIGLALAIVLPKPDPRPVRRLNESTSSTPAAKPKSTVRVENGVLQTTWPATPNESVRDVAQALASLSWDMAKNTRTDVHTIEITLMFFTRDGGMPTIGPLVADLGALRTAQGASDVHLQPLTARFESEIALSPYAADLRQ